MLGWSFEWIKRMYRNQNLGIFLNNVDRGLFVNWNSIFSPDLNGFLDGFSDMDSLIP